MSGHTPGPCGCVVELWSTDRGWQIVYCPTHDQAPAMLGLLRDIALTWDDETPPSVVTKARAILRALEEAPMSTFDHYESLRDRANRLAADLRSLCSRVEPLLNLIEEKEATLRATMLEMEAAERAVARPGWRRLNSTSEVRQPPPNDCPIQGCAITQPHEWHLEAITHNVWRQGEIIP